MDVGASSYDHQLYSYKGPDGVSASVRADHVLKLFPRISG